ncbi:fibronectin type III domain-containing protein, partial [Intrasporangium mesophilum]
MSTPALAATPLNIFVGYMDTHSVASSTKQPNPWPYTDPTSYVGSPCPAYPNSTTCWDAAALRLDNPGSVDVTGVHVVVTIGSSTYNLWGASLTVRAHGTLVLTETGAQNSTNFDGSDFSPNSYNGGNTASCVNSGAIPDVKVTIGGSTTSFLDSGQVLNGGGVDSGHCVNGSFVTGRIDESHPWAQIGSAAATAPSAPQGLSAVAADASVSLAWGAPTSDGGSAITGYNVYRGTSAGGEGMTPIATNVATTSYTDAGRTNGTTYFYVVSAVNAAGVSQQSSEASATPQSTQPTAPAAPSGLTAVGGNASVALTWTAPPSNGGSPIIGYSVYRGVTPGGESPTPIATNVTGSTFTDTGEVNGNAYYYKVAATNAVGTSPQSNEASATPHPTVSSAPVGLVASAGDGSVALSWQMPTSDGGSGITGYNVYRGTSAGAEGATPVASNVSVASYTDTSVTNGTAYFYTVAAVNAVGTSVPSNEASATPHTALTAPSAPLSLGAVAGNTTVTLSWSVPSSNGGSAITGYNVYRGTGAGAEGVTPIASGVSATSFTDTVLTNGTAYFYTVAAVNAVGVSPPSNEASATPHATAPSAPQSVVAVGGDGSVTLSWSAPASSGGSTVTGYNVYRGTSAGAEGATPIASGVSATSFT